MKQDQHGQFVQDRMKKSARYRRAYARYSRHVDLAMLVHQMREAAGFTQAELASHAGTTQSAIARLEDAAYTAHSLQTIEKIAAACGVSLTLRAQKKRKLELEVSLA